MKPTQSETTTSPAAPPLDFRTRQLFLACAGLILVSGVLVALALFHLRKAAIESGERLTASFAHIVEEQTTRSIQLVDQRLQAALNGLAQLDATNQLTEQRSRTLLKQQLSDLPLVRAIWFLNTEGRIKYDSDTGNIGLNLADRDYFQIFRTQPLTMFYVGHPVRSRTTGTWLISVARPVHTADGKFAGVIVAAVEPSYFQTIWRQADFGAGATVALWRRDGTLMMRSPIKDEEIGKNFSTRPLFSKWLPASPVGAFQNSGLFDDDLRSLAYRTLATQPDLVMVVTQSLVVILKPWREFAMLALTIWIVAVTILLGLCVFVSRMWKQRARAEAAGREMAQRLALATDVASIGIWDWNVDADTLFATSRCFTMLGDDRGDGNRSREQWLERVHPEDRHTVVETVQAALAGADSDYTYEVRMWHADGSLRWVTVAGRVLTHNADGKPSRILGIRMDVTERKRAETAMQESEERYRALVEWSPEPVCVHRDGKIIYVNPATVKMVAAKSAQELVGRSVLDLIHPDSRQIVLARLKNLAGGDTQNTLYELKFVKLDGTAIDVEIRGT
ncbi:MAG: PAS domain S-box protein, partial [Betaproteobacteria bacterium]